MTFCHICNTIIRYGCYKCMLCDNYAHEYCAQRSGRINNVSEYFCSCHSQDFADDRRKKYERRYKLFLARSINSKKDNDDENWGENENSDVEELEEEVEDEEEETEHSDSESQDSEESDVPENLIDDDDDEESEREIPRSRSKSRTSVKSPTHERKNPKGSPTHNSHGTRSQSAHAGAHARGTRSRGRGRAQSSHNNNSSRKKASADERKSKNYKASNEKESRKKNHSHSRYSKQKSDSESEYDSDYEYFKANKEYIRKLRRKEAAKSDRENSRQRERPQSSFRHKSRERSRVSFSADVEEEDSSINSQQRQSEEQKLILELLRRQDQRDARLETVKLPIVKTIGPDWLTFYHAFANTYKFHSAYSNVLRVQEAIQCPEIIAMGGRNLFSAQEYLRTIQDINVRIGDPRRLTMQALKELLKMKSPKDVNDKNDTRVLIDFITAVKNYANLLESYGDAASRSDPHTLALLVNMLPREYQKRWYDRELLIENNGRRFPTLMDLRDFLSSLVPTLERMQYGKDLISLKEDDKRSKPQKSTSNQGKLHNTNDETDKPAWKYKCWVCKSDSHLVKTCSEVRKMDGSEVIELGKRLRICLICCRERYNGDCTAQNKPPVCKHCSNKSHWYTVCPKRKGNFASTQNSNNNHKTSEDQPPNESETVKKDPKRNQKPKPQNVDVNNTHGENPSNNQAEFFRQEDVERQIDPNLLWGADIANNRNMHHGRKMSHMLHKDFRLYNTFESITRTNKSLLSVVVIRIQGNLRALLLDSGSTISLIEEEYVNDLKIGGFVYPLTLYWSGNQKRADKLSRVVKIPVSTLADPPKHFTLFFHTFHNLDIGDQKFNSAYIKAKYPYLSPMNIVDYDKIVGVIGIDQVFAFEQHKKFLPPKSEPDNLIGIRGPLGDFVMGSSEPVSYIYNRLMIDNDRHHSEPTMLPVHYHQSEKSELIRLEEYLLGDDYYKINLSDRDDANNKLAIEILKNNVKKSSNGKNYEAPLLWKDENPVLPTESSYLVASRRLKIMLENATRKGNLNEIEDQVKNLLEKGYASEVSAEKLKNPTQKAFYIPIFFISPPGKRMRMIWDAKAEVEKGKSLNSFLLPGPNLYNDMIQILYKMREGLHLLKGDCSEMFHQIQIREEDKDALRFLFKFSNEPVKTFKMDRMVFGVVCSPSTSQFVIRKIADEHMSTHPFGATILKENLYVDDLILSINSIEDGNKVIFEAREILQSGGFELVKLNATNKAVFEVLKNNFSLEQKLREKIFSDKLIEKLLGYEINFDLDTIQISLASPRIKQTLKNTSKPTKKEVLQVTLSLFDPLGLTMFLVSKFKLIYHWICNEKIDWDEVIPEKLMSNWNKVVSLIPKLNDIAIPRCYSERIMESENNQLWTFVDAGKEMQCVVTFVRFLDQHKNQIDYRIVGSKTYTVPSKQKRTIPELELDVVERGLSFTQNVVVSHSIKFHEIYILTDSSCVFEWITNGCTNPTVFVKNRLKKISAHNDLQKEIPIKLLWIPSELQTADLGTKWNSFPEFSYENEWFKPKLFSLPESLWPKFVPPQHYAKFNLKKAENYAGNSINENSNYFGTFFDSTRHSSLGKAIHKVKSLLLRWKFKTQNKVLDRQIKALKVQLEHKKISKEKFEKKLKKFNAKKEKLIIEQNDVNHCREEIEKLFIKDAQQEKFSSEIKLLEEKKILPRTSKLYKISAYLDDEGILRATTRLTDNEENRKKFPFNQIRPIILPSDHNVTKLIILQAHASNRHIHNHSIIAQLMQKYFIPHIKWTVNRIIKENCMACRIKMCKPVVPMMGDLPSLRLDAYSHPFKNTIVDVCGPFTVVVGRSRAKRWLFVATCLTTRAIHIEILFSLSGNSAILALNNLIHIRGKPDVIYSDMGTNFIGGYKEIQECFNSHNEKLIKQGMEPLKLIWEFSPAKASHMNGCVERLIGLTKNALQKMEIMMNKKLFHLNDESFRAFICETVGILNNRPLCMTPINDSQEFLTPNHFLMLKPNFISRPAEHDPKLIQKMWREVQALSNILWDHWLKAYLPTILYRQKWIDKKTPLQIGDIVITADPTIYNSWRLGKVVDIEHGSQQQVRKLKVELGKNNPINDMKTLKSRKALLKAYKAEKSTIVSRPATCVAAIKLRAEN